MSKVDFDWIANLIAAMYVRGDITQDGVTELRNRLAIRYVKFDKDRFDEIYAYSLRLYQR